MPVRITRKLLDDLYKKYNRRVFVSPDPLQFLYDYDNIRDREIVGLIASALAYGRVNQILKSIKIVLDRLSPSPSEFIKANSGIVRVDGGELFYEGAGKNAREIIKDLKK